MYDTYIKDYFLITKEANIIIQLPCNNTAQFLTIAGLLFSDRKKKKFISSLFIRDQKKQLSKEKL